MTRITTGAPNTLVTVEMFSSVGANSVRAIRSQPMQNTAPPRNTAGITTMGFDVFRKRFFRYRYLFCEV